MNKAKQLKITEEEKRDLESIVRKRTIEYQTAVRAKIILLKAAGEKIDKIAEKIDLNRNSIILCIKKYREGGIKKALYDEERKGRNPEITDEEKSIIIDIACKKPKDFGYAAETWTYSKLTSHINENAKALGYTRLESISKTSVKRILDALDIKPFRIEYYCEKRDSEFESKMHNVLVVYKQLSLQFERAKNLDEISIHTISYDEKPGIQAISNTSVDLPVTKEYGTIKRDYEYKRQGTLSLLAGIDLLTGEVFSLVSETHKSGDFIGFLKILDNRYNKEDKIRLVLDNHSSHTSKETQEYLKTRKGRFEFVFTPKHGSWLNIIESFFSKMTKQMLRHIRVKSKDELKERIYKYFDEVNQDPVIPRWHYKMDNINPNENIKSLVI